jgi:hypothetical protein
MAANVRGLAQFAFGGSVQFQINRKLCAPQKEIAKNHLLAPVHYAVISSNS